MRPAKHTFKYLRDGPIELIPASDPKSSVSCVLKPHGSAGPASGPRIEVRETPVPSFETYPSACAKQSLPAGAVAKLHGYRAGRRSELTVLAAHVSK